MQRCTDCTSSPVADLASNAAAQGWASEFYFSGKILACLIPFLAVFTLNEPDINGISPSDAASW